MIDAFLGTIIVLMFALNLRIEHRLTVIENLLNGKKNGKNNRRML